MKINIIKFVIKVLIYALSLVAGSLGLSTLYSCTSQCSVSGSGVTHIYRVDTTTVTHSGFVRSKNYKNY